MSDPQLQFETATELPPLRIHHFLVWMAVAAVVLSFYSAVFRTNEFGTDQFLRIFASVPLILMAVAAATLVLGISWKIKGRPFFDEVGQWLLLYTTLGLLETGLSYTILLASNSWPSGGSWYLQVLISLLPSLLVGVSLLFASRTAADTATWKRFCKHVGVMCLLGALLLAIGTFISFFPTDVVFVWRRLARFSQVSHALQYFVIPIYWGILCAMSVREDLMSGRRRHWSHWCGIITWLANAVAVMVSVGYFYSTF